MQINIFWSKICTFIFPTTMLAIAQEETPPRGDVAHVKSAPEAAAQVVGVRQPKGGGIAPKV